MNKSIQYQQFVCTEFNGLKSCYPYLPTPPLGQDMTQGQFLS